MAITKREAANRIGDAHGRGVDAVRVEPRYARLAVNMSGAMATFLVETWDIERAREAFGPRSCRSIDAAR
jgi:hypothetical protein